MAPVDSDLVKLHSNELPVHAKPARLADMTTDEQVLGKLLSEFDGLPEIDDLMLAHAQFLIQEFAENVSHPMARRIDAARFAHNLADNEALFGASDDIKTADNFFSHGVKGAAEMVIASYKKRWPSGKCTGTYTEADVMTYIYTRALAELDHTS